MKIALLIALASQPQPTQENDVDFSKFPCSSYINIISRTPATSEAGKSINSLHTWLYGYVSGKSENSIMSQQQARSFIKNLVSECAAHPDKSVLEASETAYDTATKG